MTLMDRVFETYWDNDKYPTTKEALPAVVELVQAEQAERIAALEQEIRELRTDEYLVKVIEERERYRKALEDCVRDLEIWISLEDALENVGFCVDESVYVVNRARIALRRDQ